VNITDFTEVFPPSVGAAPSPYPKMLNENSNGFLANDYEELNDFMVFH